MNDIGTQSLEGALSRTQGDAETTVRAATAVTAALKRCRTAARDGNLRDLRAALDAAEQSAAALQQQVAALRAGWDFDEDGYFAGGAYLREVLDTAQSMGVAVYERDERLYCYPSLVRLLSNDRAVLIDKTRDRRLRPSVLVAHLRDLQRRPPKFRPEAFVQSLAEVYALLVSAQRRVGAHSVRPLAAPVIALLKIYDTLTILPGQSRDYSRQEFARDLYLLDQSGVVQTRRGDVLHFEAGTGTRAAGATITVVTQNGQEKRYYGIAFTRDGRNSR
jgi:hypothetical protein